MSGLAQRLFERAERGERLSPEAFSRLIAGLLCAAGVAEDEAAIAAEVLLYIELRGVETHGAFHMPVYVRRMLEGTLDPRARPEVAWPSEATCMIEGRDGFGVVIARKAVDLIIPAAQRLGIAAAAVRDSSHFGVAGYFVGRMAEAGLVGLAFSNAAPTMAAWGGRRPLLGTNPLAAAFPRPDGDPIIIDLATTRASRARLRQAERDGTPIPLDWAFDTAGQPTADPAAAMRGSMQPLGGAKGFGIALMVELLCATLAGGRPGFDVANPHDRDGRPMGASHLFIAISPAGLGGAEGYAERVSQIAAAVLGSPAADPAAPVRLPGARGFRVAEERRRTGIPIKPRLLTAVTDCVALLEAHGRALPADIEAS